MERGGPVLSTPSRRPVIVHIHGCPNPKLGALRCATSVVIDTGNVC